MNKKPSFFLVFKLIGVISIVAAIFGFTLSITGFGDFESNNFIIGAFIGSFGLFVGSVSLMIGFRPEVAKMTSKSARYIMEDNKDDLSSMATTSAEIVSDAVTNTASAVMDGLSQKNTYCKHCGEKIDIDSKFCSHCGKEQ